MKNIRLLFVASFCFASISGYGAGSMISHGGLGFLYPDHNSFSDPGQLALDNGTAVQVAYTTKSNNQQTLDPTVAYGNGHFGFEVGVDRQGTSVFSLTGNNPNKTDYLEAGLGFAMANQRLTLGVDARASIDTNQTNNGIYGATLVWNGAKRMGFSAGIGATTEMGDINGTNTQTGTVAMGWGFSPTTKIEADAIFNNLSNTSDYDLAAYLNYDAKMLYLSAGYKRSMLNLTNEIDGRLGLDFGKVDVSVTLGDVLGSGSTASTMTYGGTARIVF